jgi:transcriptional regulator of heat shock response
MSFYKELAPFVEYIHSIRKLKNYLSFDMVFPSKWSLPKSLVEDGQIVGFEVEDQNMKGISFVSPISEKEISTTLTKIVKIIKLNKEKELKERLFKQTVEQLKQTFEKTDLDKLQNLYFDFDEEDTSLEIEDEEEPNLEIHEQDGPVDESHEDGGE